MGDMGDDYRCHDAIAETGGSSTKRRNPVLRSFSSPAKIEEDSRSSRLVLPMRSSSSTNLDVILGEKLLLGLSTAGVAWYLLTTTFDMFHVELFLNAYRLPLQIYSVGSFAITIINTVGHLVGAWIVDHMLNRARIDLTGVSGWILTLCFLTPFFRWKEASDSWNGVHYVVSLALYHTMVSFSSILMASVVNDDHLMTDQARINYMASSRVASVLSSFVVMRIGLALFDASRLHRFRMFLIGLAVVAILLFGIGQILISRDQGRSIPQRDSPHQSRWRWLGLLALTLPRQEHLHADTDLSTIREQSDPFLPVKPLQWRQVARDFWKHDNFKAWIGMEMLLEAQTTFIFFFLKTFVDGLLLDSVLERDSCDWLLSIIRPATDILSFLVYIPIRKIGYHRVYMQVFYCNLVLSLVLLWVGRTEKFRGGGYWVLLFICTYPTITGAVQSAGFHLAQADMVMEMKRNQALEGRHNEPSLAGLFMGANALFCKPVEAILPVTAANVLVFSQRRHESSGSTHENLFYLLAVPPLVFSCLQILAWNRFNLTPLRTSRLRDELQRLRASCSTSSHRKATMDVI